MRVRFRNVKGIDDFIRLAEELPEITFIWAGGFHFGGMTDGYERYKKIMDNPPENLIFPGIVSPGTDARTLRYGGSILATKLQRIIP